MGSATAISGGMGGGMGSGSSVGSKRSIDSDGSGNSSQKLHKFAMSIYYWQQTNLMNIRKP